MPEPIIWDVQVDASDGLDQFSIFEDILTSLGDLTRTVADGFADLEMSLSALTDAVGSVDDSIAGLEDALSGVSSASESAAGGLDTVSASAESAGVQLSMFNDLGGTLMKWGMNALILKQVGQSAVDLGLSLLAPNASMEQLQVAFSHLMHSSSGAQSELQKLYSFAAVTPFQFPDIAASAESMLGVGIAAQKVIPDITAIGDALSTVGQTTPADLSAVTFLMDKIQASGKLTAVSMMEMGRHMLPAWQLLEEGSGKTQAQLQALMKHGLDAKDALNWLFTGMEKFGQGGMAQQAQTFNGLMTTFEDNVKSAWRAFTGPEFAMAKGALVDLGNLVASPQFQNFAAQLGKSVGTDLQNVFKFFQGKDVQSALHDLFDTISQGAGDIQKVGGFFLHLGLNIFEAATKSGTLHDVLKAVSQGLSEVGQFVTRVGGFIETNLVPPALALIKNFADWEQHSDILGKALSVLGDILGVVSEVISSLFSVTAGFFEGLKDGNPWVVGLAAALTGVGFAIAGIKLADFVTGMVQMVGQAQTGDGFFSDLAETIQNKVSKAFDDFTNEHVPNLKKALSGSGSVEEAATNATTAVENIGTQATETAGVVETETTLMETDIAAVGTAAATTAGEEGIGKIGPAVTEAEGTVETETAVMETSFAGVAGASGIGLIGAALLTLGPLAYQAGQDMAKNLEETVTLAAQVAHNDAQKVFSDPLTQVVDIAMQFSDQSYVNAANSGDLSKVLAASGWTPAQIAAYLGTNTQDIATQGTYNPRLPHHAAGGFNLPGGWSLVGEQGPELLNLPGGSNIFPNGFLQQMMNFGAGGYGGGIGNNAQMLMVMQQMLAVMQRQGQGGLSGVPTPGNVGNAFNFFGSQFNGVTNINDLYSQSDALAGLASEYAQFYGSSVGLA